MNNSWQPRTGDAPAVSVDAGAREIRRLLMTPDRSLQRAAKSMTTAIGHGLGERSRSAGAEIPHGVIATVERMRGVYRDLRTRIAAIETQQRDAKRRVLSALDLLDASFVHLARGLGSGSATSAVALTRRAYWEQNQARLALGRAAQELR